MTHSEQILLTQSSLPSSFTSLAPSSRTSLGGLGSQGSVRRPANLGGGGRARECRQASGGLGADHVVSCGTDSRVLGGQSSASPVDPAPSPAVSVHFPPRTRAGRSCHRAEGKLGHAGTCAPGPVVTTWHLSPATSDTVSFPGSAFGSLCPLPEGDMLVRAGS